MATAWQTIDTPAGAYLERFENLDYVPARFRVIREEWDETVDPPRRTIIDCEILDTAATR